MALARRDFLRRLLASAPALAVGMEIDWEKLLWVPKPIITVPGGGLCLDELNAITLKCIMPAVADSFFRNDPLLSYLRNRSTSPVPGTQIEVPFIYSLRRSVR